MLGQPSVPGPAALAAGPPWARVLDPIDRASALAVTTVMAIMVTVVSLQVLLRYAFNESIDWADEVSRLCFVWAIFLAMPHALKRGGHVGIDLVVRFLPGRARHVTFRAMAALGVALMAAVTWQAVAVARDTWDQLMPTINASAGWFYVAVVVGSAHCVLHLVVFVATGRYTETEGAVA